MSKPCSVLSSIFPIAPSFSSFRLSLFLSSFSLSLHPLPSLSKFVHREPSAPIL